MEFFQWIVVPQTIIDSYLSYNGLAAETISEYVDIILRMNFIALYAALGLYLICHLFGGFGLYTMAKKANISGRWMAFVPFLNTYLSGKLAGEFTVFGKKMKRGGLYTMLVEILLVALYIFVLVVEFQRLDPAFMVEKFDASGSWYEFDISLVPLAARGVVQAADILSYIAYGLEFVLLFFMCILYNAFFKKYYARSPFLMTFLCAVLPLRGYVLFAVRNNAPIDYTAYMRRRMEEAARRQGYNPYGPANGNPYGPPHNGGGSYTPPSGGPDEPFSDFGSSNGSNDENKPFSDF